MPNFEDTKYENIIELRNVSQSYDGGNNWIIKGFDFLVEDKPAQGQFVVILGASGAGKSTVLRYIAGLQRPTEGTVLVKGKPVDEAPRVGMVFQQYSSLPWRTVLDNVALPLEYQGVDPKERESRALEMIELVGLAGHEQKFAQYPTLSGGQLQRIAIARSLIANPDILLMDEPFGALDEIVRDHLNEQLLQLWDRTEKTICIVTHSIPEAVYLSTRIVVMSPRPGRISDVIESPLPKERPLDIRDTPEFLEVAHRVRDGLRAGHSYDD